MQMKEGTCLKETREINDPSKYKFKASTLFNVQPPAERKKYVKNMTGEFIQSTHTPRLAEAAATHTTMNPTTR